jgi:RNA polymerase sigma-70 factor
MKEPDKLAAIFRKHARARVAVPEDEAGFEGLLKRAWEKGGGPWPEVALPEGSFVVRLAEGLSEEDGGVALEQVLEKRDLPGLYLAWASLNKVPAAIEALERHYLVKLPMLLGAIKLPDAMLDDVCQQVRMHLLVGTARSGPRLVKYTGEGKLLNWIRVNALRIALRQGAAVRETPQANLEEDPEVLRTLGHNPELDVIKRRYRSEFNQAARAAITALLAEEQDLLRFRYMDRLSTTEIALLFGVDQSTISRRLKGLLQKVSGDTKRRLQERLGLSSQEFESLLADIESQLYLSLSQILNPPEGSVTDASTGGREV